MMNSGRNRSTVAWKHSLSVLVPAFNERENLEPTVERLLRALNVTVEDFEIIVVDDGSKDGTAEVADHLSQLHPELRVIHNNRNRGLGFCYLSGIELATKTSFVYIPGDNTWPYRSFLELFGNLGKADVVTSYSTNPEVRPVGRRLVSTLYTRTLNVLFGHRMQYYNGLTIYPRSFLLARPISTYGFGFQAEALLSAIAQGLSFVEVAIPIDERTAGRSKAVTFTNIASVLKTVARTFWRLRVRGRLSLSAPRTEPAVSLTATRPFRPFPSRMSLIVTGASSGIGAALVSALAADGHRLFICGRRADRLHDVSRAGAIADARVCDVGNEAEVEAFVSWVRTLTPHVDGLLNCAGGFGAIGPIGASNSDEWFHTIRVNLFGTYLMIKHALPLLLCSTAPRIINFSGGGAFSPFPNYSAYSCAKAGIVRLTECLAAELGPQGITVNALAPGFVATEAHQATLEAGIEHAGALHYRRTKAILDEGGIPMEQVVECVRFLLSEEMLGLTGKTISTNFDPWRTDAFRDRLNDITHSDLYTMRRINIVNLPEGSLKKVLAEAWASHGTQT